MKQLETRDIEEWYKENLRPILVSVEGDLMKCDDKLPLCVWQEFGRNSLFFFELLNKTNGINQYMMTLRLLYEMVADLFFFYKNNRMKSCDKWLRKVAKVQNDESKTSEDIMEVISNFRVDATLKPDERVAEIFNDEAMYAYLSCFNHFNIMGMLWNRKGYPTAQDKEQWEYKRRFTLALQYPALLEKCVEIVSEVADCDFTSQIKHTDYQKLFNELLLLAPQGFELPKVESDN